MEQTQQSIPFYFSVLLSSCPLFLPLLFYFSLFLRFYHNYSLFFILFSIFHFLVIIVLFYSSYSLSSPPPPPWQLPSPLPSLIRQEGVFLRAGSGEEDVKGEKKQSRPFLPPGGQRDLNYGSFTLIGLFQPLHWSPHYCHHEFHHNLPLCSTYYSINSTFRPFNISLHHLPILYSSILTFSTYH